MKSLILEIPEDIVDAARIPPEERAETIKRELALHLYARGILPKAAARRLSGLDRISFDELLGRRGVPQPMTVDDLDADMRSLEGFRRKAADGSAA